MSPCSALFLQTQLHSSSTTGAATLQARNSSSSAVSEELRFMALNRKCQNHARKTQENSISTCVLMNSSTASNGKGNQLVFIQTKYKDTFTYPTADNLPEGDRASPSKISKAFLVQKTWGILLPVQGCR